MESMMMKVLEEGEEEAEGEGEDEEEEEEEEEEAEEDGEVTVATIVTVKHDTENNSDAMIKEEYSDEKDTTEMVEWTLKSILPVAPMNDGSFNPEAEPNTGEEYLRLVRYQSDKLPSLRVSESPIPPSFQKENFEELDVNKVMSILRETPKDRQPEFTWIEDFIRTFREGCVESYTEKDSNSVKGIIQWPEFGDEAGWNAFLYPLSMTTSDKVSSASKLGLMKRARIEEGELESLQPDDLLHFHPEQRQIMQLVKYHTRWISGGSAGGENPFIHGKNDMTNTLLLTERHYKWLVRLLQCLDPRLSGRQVSQLRDLAFTCIWQRAYHSPLDSSTLFYLNGIITIVAYHFGQRDLLLLPYPPNIPTN